MKIPAKLLRFRGLLEALVVLALLAAVTLGLFPGLLAGEVISVADGLYVHAPWVAVKPATMGLPANKLLYDQIEQVYPWADYMRNRLLAGELPLWNPYDACGTSFLANQNAGLFSPFHLLLLAGDSTARGLTLVALLKLAVAGLGAFALARGLGIGLVGALAAALGFALASPFFIWLGHPLTTASPLLPWSLLCAERTVRASGVAVRREAAVLGLVTLAHFLGSHPETSLHVAAATGIYGMVRAFTLMPWGAVARTAVLATALALGFAAAAVQVVPFLDALARSHPRALRLERESAHRLPLEALPLLWAPRLFGTPMELDHRSELVVGQNYAETALFAGVLPLVLIPATLAWLARRRELLTLTLLGAGSLLIAFDAFGVSSRLLRHVPLVGLGAHHRLVIVSALAMAVVGGAALERLGRDDDQGRPNPRLALLAALGGAAVIALGLWHRAGTALPSRTLAYAGLALALLAAAVLLVAVAQRRRPHPALALAALVLLAADLMLAARGANPTLDPTLVFPETPATRFLARAQRPFRTLALARAFPANTNLPHGLEDVRGYEPLFSDDYQRFWTEAVAARGVWERLEWADLRAPSVLPLLGVRYLIDGIDGPAMNAPGLALRAVHGGDARIQEVLDPMPRAFVVHEVEVVATAALAGRRLRGGFPFRTRAFVDRVPEPAPIATALRESVELEQASPERARVTVQLQAPALLVLATAADPGWSARIDGDRAPVLRADGIFLGVAVPAGRHAVEFTYFPRGLLLGAAISLVAVLALLLGLAWPERRQRTEAPAGRP